MIKITECPRDAMQGIEYFIPTKSKIKYLNQLLNVGFDRLDFGSFVSPSVVPQMKDTAIVLNGLSLDNTNTKLLAIVANKQGAEYASVFDEIKLVGYPFSVSETFQKRNTNKGIVESLKQVEAIKSICDNNNKTLLVYLSMAFGNPYNESWSEHIVSYYINQLMYFDIFDFALADTIGTSDTDRIFSLFKSVILDFPSLNISAHLHSNPAQSRKKIQAAYDAGCHRFDSAIRGFGGCPMAEDTLTGNIATEKLIRFAADNELKTGIDQEEFDIAVKLSNDIF